MTAQELLDLVRQAREVRGTERSAGLLGGMPEGHLGTLYHVAANPDEYGSQLVGVHCPYFDNYTPAEGDPDYTSLLISIYALDYLIDGKWVLGHDLEKKRFPDA